MTILVDAAIWPARDRLWAHLVSDTSFAELHEFAARVGLPARAFERDHYDIPAERRDDLIAAGAQSIGAKELVRRITVAGLRRPKGRPPEWPARG